MILQIDLLLEERLRCTLDDSVWRVACPAWEGLGDRRQVYVFGIPMKLGAWSLKVQVFEIATGH